jgi:hypothetical protein
MKRKEVTGQWRKLHIQELHNSYSLRVIIRVIISRRFRFDKMIRYDKATQLRTRVYPKFPYWLPGARTANGTALCH